MHTIAPLDQRRECYVQSTCRRLLWLLLLFPVALVCVLLVAAAASAVLLPQYIRVPTVEII
jgi:hypothetical protein